MARQPKPTAPPMPPGFRPTRYTLDTGDPRVAHVYVDEMAGTGPAPAYKPITRWAVRGDVGCWTKRGHFEYEGMSSSRTDAFLKRARFGTLDEAFAEAIKAAEYVRRTTEEMRRMAAT